MSRDCGTSNPMLGNTLHVTHNSEEAIRSWRETVPIDGGPDDGGIFTRYFDLCAGLYQTLLQKIEQNSALSNSLGAPVQKLFAKFCLWGETVNVRTVGVDSSLLQNFGVKKVTLRTLIEIGNILSRDLIHYVTHLPNARHGILQPIGASALHDEAQYIIEGSDCEKCSAGFTAEDGLHDRKTILDGLDRLTGILMSSSGIKSSHENRAPVVTLSTGCSPFDLFFEKVQTKFPQANKKVVGRLGKFYEDQLKRRQAASDAPEREILYSESQPDSTSISRADASKSHDSGLGSSVPTDRVNTATNSTFVTGSYISRIRFTQFWEPYPCVFPGCYEQDTIVEGFQALAHHFFISHGPQVQDGLLKCPICNKTSEFALLYSHYIHHLHELAPTIFSGLEEEKSNNAAGSHGSLESALNDLINVEVSPPGSLMLGAHEQRTPNAQTRTTDIPHTDARQWLSNNGFTTEEVNPFLSGSTENFPGMHGLPIESGLLSSASANRSRTISGSSFTPDLQCRISQPKAVLQPSSNPRKQSSQHICNYSGCKRTNGFSNSHDLKRHKRSVHGELSGESYVCTVKGCKKRDKSWSRRDNFKTHVTTQHPREPDEVDKVIERSRRSHATVDTQPPDHSSQQDNLSIGPRSHINNDVATTYITPSQLSQPYDPLVADELETSIMDSSSLVQHHVSRPEQAATSPDALRPSDIGNSRNFESINIRFPETYGLSPVWERDEDWYPELS